MAGITTTNFRDSDGVDLGRKLVTKDYLLEVYGTILESSGASGLVVTPELWTWGFGGDGRLGINKSSFFGNTNTPVTTFAGGNNWKQVSVGSFHTAAIKTDGSLWLWGSNESGQLGDNTTIFRSIPVTTFAGGNDWKSVAGGGAHTLAIKTDGSLWNWGSGADGRLGINNNVNRSTPITTVAGGNNWKQVAAASRNCVAVKTDGTLWCWGLNENSQAGNLGSAANIPVTTFVGGTTWKSVATGGFVTAAIKTDGTLWTWGQNGGDYGTLGQNAVFEARTPATTFAGGNNWKQVALHGNNIAAIKTDGTLWTWGYNDLGQVGDNTNTTKRTPVTTFAGGNNWKSVACGNTWKAAIKTDGTLWVFGWNSYGTLGRPTGDRISTPVTTFAGGNNWKSVACGYKHTVAIQSNDYI
jgi:alpha-tubulin suppressor-like RCC1 family protein